MQRSVTFKADTWNYEEKEVEDGVNQQLVISISGVDKDSRTVYVSVTDFEPHNYVELPKHIRWNRGATKNLRDYLMFRMGDYITSIEFMKKKNIRGKVDFNTAKITLKNHDESNKKLNSVLNPYKQINIPGLGVFRRGDFHIHQAFIDPIIKFTAIQKLPMAGWITATETINEEDEIEELSVEERKYTSSDIDMYASWKDVIAYGAHDPVPPKEPPAPYVEQMYCGFDIECTSRNPNSKLPDPSDTYNAMFQVSMIFGKFNSSEPRKTILLTLHNPADSDEYETIRLGTEKELIMKFAQLIREYDPNIFIGYNIMKFDWNYMICRAKMLGCLNDFLRMSRIDGELAKEVEMKWASSARGDLVFSYPKCNGRFNIDVLLEVESNYRLPKYSLDVVARKFLGDKKDDISPRQLFMLYRISDECGCDGNSLISNPKNKDLPPTLRQLKHRVRGVMNLRQCNGEVLELRTALLAAKNMSQFQKLIRECLRLTGKYCVKDTDLTIDILEKLNLWTAMEQMSNVMHIPPSYLHTRGQQIRVLAQVYRDVVDTDIIIPVPVEGEVLKEKYQGAIVVDAVPGYHRKVATLDFASLYPTTMIARNICLTTLLPEDTDVPDEECHILQWEDHRYCEHDPSGRKGKAEDVLCAKHRYKFRKVKIEYDEKKKEFIRKYEGIMAGMERRLLAQRKIVKKQMFQEEAKVKMYDGLADEDDLAYYKKMGWEIIPKGGLSDDEIKNARIAFSVYNAQQLAIKVSANSGYGALGALEGKLSFIQGAASITAEGRMQIRYAIKRVLEYYDDCELVYGDTDSCMIKFIGADLTESFKRAKLVSKVVTHSLKCLFLNFDENKTVKDTVTGEKYPIQDVSQSSPFFDNLSTADKISVFEYEQCPVDLEFETMYDKFLLLTKKRYVAKSVNEKGEEIGETMKGIILTRRDKCDFTRKIYRKLIYMIFDGKGEQEIMWELYDQINKMYTRQVPPEDLIIYVGINTLINYAKKKKYITEGGTESHFFIDIDGNEIKDPVGPLDTRLKYDNLPHVLLALKMMRRGTDVPPGTRLEYLLLKQEHAEYVGEQAEDYSYFSENKDILNLAPDPHVYIEKHLTNPIVELLSVMFPKETVYYENPEDKLNKHITHELDDYKAQKLARVSTFTKEYPKKKVYRGLNAKIEYILHEASTSSESGNGNQFSKEADPELLEMCTLIKSNTIVNNIRRKYGVKKRRPITPGVYGPALHQSGTKVVVYNKQGLIAEDGSVVEYLTNGEILDRRNIGTTKNPIYIFDVSIDDDRIIRDVDRCDITTYRKKDYKFMEMILNARIGYSQVVDQLKTIFSPVEFVN